MGRPHSQKLQQDISLLLAPFQPVVIELVKRMRARGFHPLVWETLRTPERAEWLASRGRSRNKGRTSMHVLGAAVDIVCRLRMWDHPEFFAALEEEAEKLGLVSGRDWDTNDDTKNRFNDGPHVQALKVKDQDDFRALTTVKAREEFIAKTLRNGAADARQLVLPTSAPAPKKPKGKKARKATKPVDTSDRTDAENEAQACLPEDEG